MKRALILDFGGVVSRTLFETHDLTEEALGLQRGSLGWRGPFDHENDPLWQGMVKDEISERDYWSHRTAEVAELIGESWSQMSDFVRAARGAEPMKVIRPEFLEAIEVAKANHCPLAILSNELDLFYGADFRDRLPFLSDFDVVVDATYTKILKPDPRAYKLCLDQLGMAARDCVFVDDQARNIKGAQSVGLNTVEFDVSDPSRSYAKALDLLLPQQRSAQ